MPEKIEFKIKPLTPIFTGGIDGKCDRLHETGIIGSMRWWFEAIIRGMGGYACDPTESKNKCPDENGNYCDACKIFGSTGLKRVFRLDILNDGPTNTASDFQIKVVKEYQKETADIIKTFNHRGWFFKPGIINDSLQMQIYYPTRPIGKLGIDANEAGQLILLPLKLMADWGGLAVKNQQGYGVFNLSGDMKFDFDKSIAALKKILGEKPQNKRVQPDVPRLDQFFFSRIEFHIEEKNKIEFWNKRFHYPKQESGEMSWGDDPFLPIAPLVRYYLRSLIREQEGWNKDLRHQLMGEAQGNNRKKSLINCSHAYPTNNDIYEMRIWGWIPETRKISGEEILTQLKCWTQNSGLLWDNSHCKLNVVKQEWNQKGICDTTEVYLRDLAG